MRNPFRQLLCATVTTLVLVASDEQASSRSLPSMLRAAMNRPPVRRPAERPFQLRRTPVRSAPLRRVRVRHYRQPCARAERRLPK